VLCLQDLENEVEVTEYKTLLQYTRADEIIVVNFPPSSLRIKFHIHSK